MITEIFNKNLIAQRWTKAYNICLNVSDFVEQEHSVELDILKYSDISPCKKQKMSRHQKYRELMLQCKEFCDVSSDLLHQDYIMICNFIKDATQAIRNGKTIVVKELSEKINKEDQKCDPSTFEEVATNRDVSTGESCKQNYENKYVEDNPKDTMNIQDDPSSNLIEENKQKVSKDEEEEGIRLGELIVDKKEGGIRLHEAIVEKEDVRMPMQELIVDIEDEKIQMQNEEIHKQEMLKVKEEGEKIQEIEEETLSKIKDRKNDDNSTELNKTNQTQSMTFEHTKSKSTDVSMFSYLKTTHNFEVLKNVHLQKKCMQCGRPSKKRAALSFASASTLKKKSKLKFSKSSEQDVSATPSIQSSQFDTCDSQIRQPNQAESKHSNIKPSLLQVVRQSGSWLDDQIIKASMDALRNQYPMFRGFHNTLLGSNLSFPITKPPFIQILHVNGNHWITVEAVTLNFVRVYDSLYNSTDISAQMQIAALIRSPEPVIELDVKQTVSSGFLRLWFIFYSLRYRFSLWKQSCCLQI